MAKQQIDNEQLLKMIEELQKRVSALEKARNKSAADSGPDGPPISPGT